MRKLRFVTASKANPEQFQKTLIHKSVASRFDLYACLENATGLPTVYNRFLNGDFESFTFYGESKGRIAPDDIFVFVHDDVEVLRYNPDEELNRWANSGFSIMGLAGAVTLEIKSPALWHLMCPPEMRSGVSIFHMSHYISPTEWRLFPDYPVASTFGPLREVVVVDGVFMAFTHEAISSTGFRFDEEFTFHHYDIAACITAHQLKLRMRTVFIPIIHLSPGIDNGESRPDWVASEKLFLKKFKPAH